MASGSSDNIPLDSHDLTPPSRDFSDILDNTPFDIPYLTSPSYGSPDILDHYLSSQASWPSANQNAGGYSQAYNNADVEFGPNQQLFHTPAAPAGTVAPSDVFKPVMYQPRQPKLPTKDSRGHGMSVGLEAASYSACNPSSLSGSVLTVPCSSHQVIQHEHLFGSEILWQNCDNQGQNVTSPVAQSQSGQSSAQALFSYRHGVTVGSQGHSDENGSLSEAGTTLVSQSLTKRPRSCLACRRSRQECGGHPICARCCKRWGLSEELQGSEPTLIDTMFLDESFWQSLNQGLEDTMATLSVNYSRCSPLGESPIILHIDLEHLVGSQRIDASVPVVLRPINTLKQSRLRTGGEQQPLREPTICLAQLDSVVRNLIWHSTIKHMGEKRFTDDEREIFDLARLFCGYFAILYDLHRTSIHTEYGEELKTKLVALELVYAIGIRLQRLFAALASKIQTLLHATVTRDQQHRSVIIYALEIIYRGMKKCGTLNWGLSEDHILHPIGRMCRCLMSRSEYLLSRIARVECWLSASRDIKTFRNPTLQFLRNGNIKLPAALIIAPKRHSSLEMSPLSQNGWPVRSFLDTVLCHGSLDADIIAGNFKTKRWTGDIYQGHRYSDVDSADNRANVVMLNIQFKSKCPKASHEASAVASSIREPRHSSVANTANDDLTCNEVLDNLLSYPPFSGTGDEHRLDYDTNLEFEQSSAWLPSTPSLAQGQSNATWPNVHSLTPIDTQQMRLESGVHLVRALPTLKNVSKVPGYSGKRHVDSDASSSSSYKTAQETLNRPRKRAKTKAESDNAASGQQVGPK